MSDAPADGQKDRPEDGQEGPDVGSVGEEAVKLFGALADWARTQGSDEPAGATGPGLAGMLRNLDNHVAGEDCRLCPVCRVIHAVRETSPEVKEHLTVAAGSFLQAVAGLLATQVPPTDRPGSDDVGVQKIDLTDDGTWDDPR